MKKAKRLAAVILCLCALLLLLPPVGSSAEGLSFISVNDLLPSELVDSLYTYGGTLYVPYTVFTEYGLGLYYSYFTESSTAYLYTVDRGLFFCLSDGRTHDADGYYYSTSAVLRNGVVYLPVSFMCSYFGLSYSYMTSSPYGNVLRIKNGSQVLTDTEFIRAAKSVMESHYDAYNAAQPPASTPVPTPVKTPDKEDNGREELSVSLSFIGPPSADLLDTLDAYGVKGCFFLTGEDVLSDPDLIRRAAGEGHALGVYCLEDAETEYGEVSALIFEAARVKTVLVTPSAGYAAECAADAEALGLVCCERELDAVFATGETASAYYATSELEAAQTGADIFMDTASAERTLPTLLEYLTRNRYGILLLRETGD